MLSTSFAQNGFHIRANIVGMYRFLSAVCVFLY